MAIQKVTIPVRHDEQGKYKAGADYPGDCYFNIGLIGI